MKKIAQILILAIAPAFLLGNSFLTPSVSHTSALSPTARVDESASEIPAFDPITNRVFVSNDATTSLDVLELDSNESTGAPTLTYKFSIDLSSIGGGVNAVAVKNGLVAVAVQNSDKQAIGKVAIFSTTISEGDAPLDIVLSLNPSQLAQSKKSLRAA